MDYASLTDWQSEAYNNELTKPSTSGAAYIQPLGINPSRLADTATTAPSRNKSTSLGLSEQLYTAAGSQGYGVIKSQPFTDAG